MSSNRVRLAPLCVLVVLAGCVGTGGETTEDEVRERLETTEPPTELVATLEMHIDRESETDELTQDLWLRDDGAFRIEMEYNGSKHVSVSDGDQLWTHNERAETVTVHELDESAESQMALWHGSGEHFFEELAVTEASETSIEGHDAYHVVFGLPGDAETERSVMEILTAPLGPLSEDNGTTATDENFELAENGSVELWLDREFLFPIQLKIEGEDELMTTRFVDIAFEPGLEDDRFTFEPPADAEVTHEEIPDSTTFETVEDAAAVVPYEISRPTGVPDGYERERVLVNEFDDADRTDVAIIYDDSDDGFLVVHMTDGRETVDIDGEPVTIDGHEGAYDPDAPPQRVTWHCEELGYTVTASDDVARPTLLELADSIGCPS